ncbi:GNAT family N-acetyltransferase [candidate division KSB1 bacterium]|nr:GNAT family N-acetyltransferase [candidate division KSB1 bacterium]
MNMQVTYPQNEKELEAIADLRGKVFRRASYYFFYEERMRFHKMDPWFKPEHVRIVKEDNRIVSAVTIVARPVRFGPAVVKMGGIGDVLTVPECRGKGYSRVLMESAVEYMKGHNFDLTVLFGIPNYYHKFGYLEGMRNYQLELLDTSHVPEQARFHVRQFQVDDIPEMLRLYQANMRHCHLVIDRNTRYMECKINQRDLLIVITDSKGKLAGYAHTWDHIGNKFAVMEAMTAERDASLALLSEILKQKPTNEPLIIKMSPQMPFVRHVRSLGSELKIRSFGEGEGMGMVAVIDLCQLINNLKPLFNERLQTSKFNTFSGKLKIACDQPVQLLFDDGELKSCTPAANDSTAGFWLDTDLRYFSRNLIGYWTIRDLLDHTDAKSSNSECLELLEVLFPETEPFMLPWDYF